MEKKPLIGLTPSHLLSNDDLMMRPTYMRAITHCGAIPVIMPLEAKREDMAQLADTLDGVLFTGGPDLHPFLYGEDIIDGCEEVSPFRDSIEPMMLSLMMERKKPILGVCRGLQMINVALGGTLYQDLNKQMPGDIHLAHSQPNQPCKPSHRVRLITDSRLFQISGQSTLEVNSLHHQAIKDLAPGLIASAYAQDQLVEAVELPGYPYLLAVQWHPEHLWQTQPEAQALFTSFVSACKA